ncbi:hypothetical protein TVAG_378950 [Trichomonas vaginalis G3]|uniref:Peptidase C1A papain C-terminal domain-containing protein n=1 Tax=Trichomonas vaginalis (strain ATCC PRA-98 / G3) TaxID=412133 RepID=A2DB86_TRIV3|nr:cysteine proteinases family [Trichomonas vaginalis G3]EAY22416.1 hypothetical protein TVAG_378950 [Trichomonas vaginalis G3]KAI5517637.1 cysteine proteinases family [Trichomonas vaginalis G3]|eukprot:XP_001583402.1 hypothetical protein [Trichomonas vaginalis G3]
MFIYLCFVGSLRDSDPLITQEMVDAINNDPNAPFKAKLYPKFAKMTVGDAKRFLSPVRHPPQNQGSAVPVGANEEFFNWVDNNYITGLTNVAAFPNDLNASNQNSKDYSGTQPGRSIYPYVEKVKFPVFDVTNLCSSWAPAVTSAMTISVSRWAGEFVNFSLQYVLDCDMLGDSCVERTPVNAYQLFWTYHPPDFHGWDNPGDLSSERFSYLQAPRSDFTRENCADNRCYPGLSNCKRHWALTGSCNSGASNTGCPIYFLYNWRWIKSHLWEVGAVTSSITVYPSIFIYNSGIYSGYFKKDSNEEVVGNNTLWGTILGMLDVTIVGWGQKKLNLSTDSSSHTKGLQRWWWVIPHFGSNFGIPYEACNSGINSEKCKTNKIEVVQAKDQIKLVSSNGNGRLYITSRYDGEQTGIPNFNGFMKFNRRFDDCNIESHAVGAVPYNFVPLPHRTPHPTEVESSSN